jgi:hypothetical protein
VKVSRFCTRAVEFRAEGSGDGRTLEGYAAVFNDPTRIDSWEGMFDEQIARGAFAKTIAERKPVLQFDHGYDARTGSVPIGALDELREDRRGLYVRARLFDNAVVEPIRQAIEGGAIDGMSFRFKVPAGRDTWKKREGDVDLRTIREVELYELGPVVFPAYASTSVGVRSLLAGLDDDDRARLVHELAELLRTTPDADQQVTSEPSTVAPAQATRGLSPHVRARLLAVPTLTTSGDRT